MRHEWKLERSTQETEGASLERQQADLEKLIETAQEEEESALQESMRRECHHMRDAYRRSEILERRLHYLQAQSRAHSDEFRHLGDVAGVPRLGRADGFNHDDPSTYVHEKSFQWAPATATAAIH